MKKITAVILSLAVLFCAVAVMAEDTGKVTIGTVSINGAFTLQCGLPEGYAPVPVSVTQEEVDAVIRSDDPNAPVMYLSVAFDEKYYDVERFNDLPQEELELLEETFIEDDPGVEISYGETGYGTLLLVARHETETLDYIAFFSIYKGYCVHFVLAPSEQAEDKNLTEEQLKLCVDFLTDLDFVPANVPVRGRASVAAGRYVARITDYNAEENTVEVEVLNPVRLNRKTADGLQVGDTLVIGQESVTVETLEKDEFGVLVNDEIELRYNESGDVSALFYEHEYMETVASLTLQIPDALVFMDEIDPESGEMLEEMTEHTAAEFAAMLAEDSDPGFASDNVYITFDEAGGMVRVERIYTPWQ